MPKTSLSALLVAVSISASGEGGAVLPPQARGTAAEMFRRFIGTQLLLEVILCSTCCAT